jgi:hypothetical protein
VANRRRRLDSGTARERPTGATILADVNLQPKVLRVVLGHGLPATVEVIGESMTPSLEVGAKLLFERPTEAPAPGDIVLIISADERQLLVHRVMHVFSQGGRGFVMHQGDAASSTFAICETEAVIGRATKSVSPVGHPLPTLDRLAAPELVRFRRRRRACALYALGRRVGTALQLGDRQAVRRVARAIRSFAGAGRRLRSEDRRD